MKKYMLIDLNSDYKEICDYDKLKDLLIQEIKRDTLDSHEEYGIVENNINVLIKMINESHTTISYIKDILLSYSYKVVDLYDLQRDLEDMKQYFEKNYYTSAFDEVIAKINEVNK